MTYEESFTVELKREINADFKKEIVAFANSDGGEDVYKRQPLRIAPYLLL